MGAAEWVLDLCDRLAECTDGAGAVTRLFLGSGARAAQELLREEMLALGMQVRVDAAGNLRGLYAAEQSGAGIFLVGSHIDTVPDAGRYDGVLGVAVMLAAVRELHGRRLNYAIEVIAFSEEEGIRFRLPYIGSRALVGTLGRTDLHRVDDRGTTVSESLAAFGLDVRDLDRARLTPGTLGFLEVHIEQGPVLEAIGLPLAVVTGVAGQMQLELTFHGRANHAGTTPMHLRQDAVAAAAALVCAVESYALGVQGLVATVGTFRVGADAPNRVTGGAANVVAGTARVTLDVRHGLDAVRERAAAELLQAAGRIGEERGVSVTVRELSRQNAVAMDVDMVERIAAAVRSAGYPVHRMVSGAGHDAMILAREVPTGMLFVRTPGGLSHCPQEAVLVEDVEAALEVVVRVLGRC